MSRDILLFASRRPRDIKPPETLSEQGCTADGPRRITQADLPDALDATSDLRWLVEFSSPHELAEALLLHVVELARATRGVVWDPTAGDVRWPRAPTPTRAVVSQRVSVVRLLVFFTSRSDRVSLGRRIATAIDAGQASAMPSAFGTFEPLRSGTRLLFENAIQNSSLTGETLHWRSRAPYFGGSVSFPAQAERGCVPTGSLVLTSVADYVRGNADDLVDKLAALTESIPAFYGCAFLERWALMRGNRLSFDGESEMYPLPPIKCWWGLPEAPMWLSWFGRPYDELVERSLPAEKTASLGPGILFRAEDHPRSIDELQRGYPELPRSLLATSSDGVTYRSADLIPEVG